jgi:protein transport protein SEC24
MAPPGMQPPPLMGAPPGAPPPAQYGGMHYGGAPPGGPPPGAPPPPGMGAPPGSAPRGPPPPPMGAAPGGMRPGFGAPPPGAPPMGVPPPQRAQSGVALGAPPPPMGAPPMGALPPQRTLSAGGMPMMGAPPPPMTQQLSGGFPPASGSPRSSMGGPPSMMVPPGPPGGMGMPPMSGSSRTSMSMGAPPPPPGGMAGGYAPGPPGAPDFSAPVEGMATLSLGGGAGGEAVDAGALPRPQGDVPADTLPGSCDPLFMRLTVNALPASAALRQRYGLPVALLLQPLAPTPAPVPVVNPGGGAIVRCRRCRTYINPFCAFTDGGRRWRCNCCTHLNEVPVEYFCSLDASGRRRDWAERPELCTGSVEYIAPAEYMVRPPMPPVYFFVLDVSAAAVASGYLARACAGIKAQLDALPGDGRTQVGLLTYDAALHFYALRAGAAAPRMMVVADVTDTFLPTPEDLLVNLAECRSVFEAALDLVPSAWGAPSAAPAPGADAALGPAMSAALAVMQHVGGKLLLFAASLPSVGEGKLRMREDARLFGTDREHALRNPEDGFYKKLSAECSRVQICVDLFALGGPYMDVATLSVLPKYTGGQLYHLPCYADAVDGERLSAELTHNLCRPTAWEAVMRVRCAKGFRVAAFHGHFFVRSTDLLALPAADGDKAYAIQIAHEETVAPTGVTYMQCALLHTTSGGERRIRVHTLAVPVVSELGDMFRAVDGGATAAMVAKLAVERSLNGRLEEARSSAAAKCAAALKEYRLLHAGAAARAYGRLCYPEPLALLPLFTLAAGKCAALRGGFKEVPTDVRAAAAFDAVAAPVGRLLKTLYPTAYALHLAPPGAGLPAPDGSGVPMPPLVPLSGERIDARGWYLVDDARALLLWVGAAAPPEALRSLLGAGSAAEAAAAAGAAPLALRRAPEGERGSPAAVAGAVVAALRAAAPLFLQLRVVLQGTPGEQALFPFLVEDRGPGALSYTEHLLQVRAAASHALRAGNGHGDACMRTFHPP